MANPCTHPTWRENADLTIGDECPICRTPYEEPRWFRGFSADEIDEVRAKAQLLAMIVEESEMLGILRGEIDPLMEPLVTDLYGDLDDVIHDDPSPGIAIARVKRRTTARIADLAAQWGWS